MATLSDTCVLVVSNEEKDEPVVVFVFEFDVESCGKLLTSRLLMPLPYISQLSNIRTHK